MTTIDPAVRAQITAGLGEDRLGFKHELDQAQAEREFGLQAIESDYNQAVQRVQLGHLNSNLIAKGKAQAAQQKAVEQARAKAQAARKDSPGAKVAALEKPVDPNAGAAGPVSLTSADVANFPVGSQGGGPQLVQQAKAAPAGESGSLTAGETAPPFVVSANQRQTTGPYRYTPYMTAPATTTTNDVVVRQNAMTPGELLRAKVAESYNQSRRGDSTAALLGGTIGLQMIDNPAEAQKSLDAVAQQYGPDVAQRVVLEAMKARDKFKLQEKRSQMEDKLVSARQSEGRSESDANARRRLIISDQLARARKDAADVNNPNRAMAAQKAMILGKLGRGEPLTKDDQAVLDATKPFNTLEWALTQSGEGAPKKTATHDDYDRILQMWKAENGGKSPSTPQLHDYMAQKGYVMPNP